MIQTILLAEDDRGTALLVKIQLERHGYKVLVAYNGVEALTIIRSEKIDLLITDVVMPEMDGVDLYLELKKIPETRNLPIIIVTDKQVFKDSFFALGVNHCVTKTSDISLLLEKIKEVGHATVETQSYRKILVAGANSATVEQMKVLLQGKGALVSTADTTMDLVSKAFLMHPHLILLDISMKESVAPEEAIRSLQCYHFLSNTMILTYACLSPDEMGIAQGTLESMAEQIKVCQEAGATKYLGRFNRVTFLESLQELGAI
jgi:CheY-like chemotaxis protein